MTTTFKPLTVAQAVCLTVMTGTLLMEPWRFRKEVAKRIGRVALPNEFADPNFQRELQGLWMNELQAMCQLEEDSGLILPS
jgi:hypothetical protein